MASRWPGWSPARCRSWSRRGHQVLRSGRRGGSYAEFLRTQFRAVAAAIGITYEQLTGDLTA